VAIGPTADAEHAEDAEVRRRKALTSQWFAKGDVDGSGNFDLEEFQARSRGRWIHCYALLYISFIKKIVSETDLAAQHQPTNQPRMPSIFRPHGAPLASFVILCTKQREGHGSDCSAHGYPRRRWRSTATSPRRRSADAMAVLSSPALLH
jgi:hypothetical protein